MTSLIFPNSSLLMRISFLLFPALFLSVCVFATEKNTSCTKSELSSQIQISMAKPKKEFVPLTLNKFKVTKGKISSTQSGKLFISSTAVRAVSGTATPQEVILRFRYLGPTKKMHSLASGKERHQIGLKIEAENACNLLYVMYRISPKPALALQLKLNPYESRSRQCSNDGYSTLASETLTTAMLDSRTDEIYVRREGARLSAGLDGETLISIELPVGARELRGKLGLRSDNGIFEAELLHAATPSRY